MSALSCRFRYWVRSSAAGHPSIFLPTARVKYRHVANRIVRPDTELVIEGFQRSGNSFATVAFEMAQGRPVRTAHHLHAAAQVRRAVRWGVPTLVLIRDPVDTIASHMVYEPCVTAAQGLRAWSLFYRFVAPLRDRVVVASFPEVTSDFGRVLERVNDELGTRFVPFSHTDENTSRCFEAIEARNRSSHGRLVETRIARPSGERAAAAQEARRALLDPALEPLRRRADALYDHLVPGRAERGRSA